ncbi:MAG TPA: DUF2125 domain-containing protein [Amaricoccus sp.]|uniref:DUF2125 domain-containing protein n=1 Tax=Amaricoccus sp. TaxID=1872485 RepID=UPI001D5104D1|nr:DUF2125 domain-containing protein [Amaricoccus sp.]MCB1374161.1 DUF2125 domain-containing protein [Paracoccaceae bacterium]MCC0065706.1 DUF2125 domain-containing protein [Rhodovulum sp.]HPG21993.1 DUF2125 domain-containing protein [Amaricoccus sp.]HRW16142.1 DUF2125 domain-containing protein [Amaricoccus sp.]
MRILLAIVILAGLAWSGWWYFGATTRQNAIESWLAGRRDAGWVAETADVRVTGFPNRIDLIVEGLDIADPEAGWAWQADRFEVLSLSYKPHHVIAAWPGPQTVATPYETVHLDSRLMRGSVIFEPDTRLTLDRSSIEIDDMALRGESGWAAAIGHANFATRQAADGAPDFAHDIGLTAENIQLPEALSARIGGMEVLPSAVERVHLDATLDFDRAWNRASVEAGNPVLEQVLVRDASVTWGSLDLRAKGTLDVDAQGFAEGRLDLRARNWREMIALAEASGTLAPALAATLRTGLGLIATLSGDAESLKVPLDFEDGVARLGPVVLGAAPRLVLPGRSG